MARHETIAIASHSASTTMLATAVPLGLPAGLAVQAREGPAHQPQQEEQRLDQTISASQQPTRINVTAGNLADHPSRYDGKRVLIQGPVEDVYSRSMFTLNEDKVSSTWRDLPALPYWR